LFLALHETLETGWGGKLAEQEGLKDFPKRFIPNSNPPYKTVRGVLPNRSEAKHQEFLRSITIP